MHAVVSCIKQVGGGRRYYCVASDGSSIRTLEIACAAELKLGDLVDVFEEGTGKYLAEGYAEAAEILRSVDKLLKETMKVRPYSSGIGNADPVIKAMWPQLTLGAQLLLRKLVLGIPIIVRFHNDADGATGAYALYKALLSLQQGGAVSGKHNIRWLMHKSVVYDTTDASYDMMALNDYSALEKPLLTIIDFGTSEGSNRGIKVLEGRPEVLWLDHHPIEQGFIGPTLQYYMNPWQFGGDSNITAGFLVAVFAKTFSNIDTKEIENASFIGDYSSYADKRAPGAELSAFLDMVTSDVRIAVGGTSKNITPSEIDAIVSDRARYAELLEYARGKMAEAIENAKKEMKSHNAGAGTIYVSDFETLRDDSTRYPLPGRFSSKLLEALSLESSKPCVLLLHFGSFISVRVDNRISERVNILQIISGLKETHPDEIDSGGGHRSAASIKLVEGTDKKQAIKELVSIIKSKLG